MAETGRGEKLELDMFDRFLIDPFMSYLSYLINYIELYMGSLTTKPCHLPKFMTELIYEMPVELIEVELISRTRRGLKTI